MNNNSNNQNNINSNNQMFNNYGYNNQNNVNSNVGQVNNQSNFNTNINNQNMVNQFNYNNVVNNQNANVNSNLNTINQYNNVYSNEINQVNYNNLNNNNINSNYNNINTNNQVSGVSLNNTYTNQNNNVIYPNNINNNVNSNFIPNNINNNVNNNFTPNNYDNNLSNNINNVINTNVNNTSKPNIDNSSVNILDSVQNNNINNKKKNNKIILIVGLSLLVIVVACVILLLFKKDKTTSRTIMLYMVGSNLETDLGIASNDLRGIKYDKIDNENVNVVMIAGGTEFWVNSYIEEDETSIFELTPNGFEKVKEQSKMNMGDASTLSGFLNYVYENYKTDEYDLVFWNHGGAVQGSEYDDFTGDFLSLSDMEDAFDASAFKDKKLELIVFRTCLNGTLEVANTFKDYSNLLVASEEITLGHIYSSVLTFINDVEEADTGYDIGLRFVNSYKEYIDEIKLLYLKNFYDVDIYSTYSIIDLTKISDLVNSLNDFVSDIDVNSNYDSIAKVRSNLYQYAYEASDEPSYDMVDLYNLVDGLKYLSNDKGENVLKNIDEAVLYNWASDSESKGISIYFPYNGANDIKKYFLDIYKSISDLDSYNNFITSFNTIQTGSFKNYSFSGNEINIVGNELDYDFSLKLTDEQLEGYARSEYIVFKDNNDGYYLPVYRGKNVVLNDNVISTNVSDRVLKVVSNKDGNEYVLSLVETSETDEYINYITYVIMQNINANDISDWKIDSVQLFMTYDKKTNDIFISKALLNDANKDTPNTIVVDINDYSHITFSSSKYRVFNDNGLYTNDWVSNGVVEGLELEIDEFSFELQEFDEEDYYAIFIIYDTNNQLYYSDIVKMK